MTDTTTPSRSISSFCHRCILRRQKEQLAKLPKQQQEECRREILAQIRRSKAASAPVLIAELNRIHCRYTGEEDRFREIKQRYNRLMLERSADIEAIIRSHPQPLSCALMFARAANFIDFGAMHRVDDEVMEQLLLDAPKLSLPASDYEAFRQELQAARRLVYLTDNCGEIILDKLFIVQLLENFPSLQITVIVRGFPALNDATEEDARQAGLTGLSRVTVMGNGSCVAGTDLEQISDEAREAITAADVIISKGQGNFETLHGCGLNIYYAFLCKCDWFSLQLGLEKLTGVFENERTLIQKWGQKRKQPHS